MGAVEPFECRAVDGGGHPAEGLAVLVAVVPDPDVDLGEGVQPGRLQGVDQQPELDAVAGREREPFEQGAAGRVLTAERLDETGEFRPVQVEQRAGDQLGDPAAAGRDDGAVPRRAARGHLQRPVVHGLDQLDVRFGEQRADDAGHEGGVELAQVGIDEADDLAAGDEQRAPEHLALAGGRGQPGQDLVAAHHPGAGRGGRGGGAVAGAGVDHDQFVDQRQALHQLPADGADDVADGGLLVQGGQHDADGAGPAGGPLGVQEGAHRTVGRAPRTAAQPGRHRWEELGGRVGGHGSLLGGSGGTDHLAWRTVPFRVDAFGYSLRTAAGPSHAGVTAEQDHNFTELIQRD